MTFDAPSCADAPDACMHVCECAVCCTICTCMLHILAMHTLEVSVSIGELHRNICMQRLKESAHLCVQASSAIGGTGGMAVVAVPRLGLRGRGGEEGSVAAGPATTECGHRGGAVRCACTRNMPLRHDTTRCSTGRCMLPHMTVRRMAMCRLTQRYKHRLNGTMVESRYVRAHV